MRAAAYVRISNDPEGRRAGVERQRGDVLELVERRGWTLTEVYEDNDTSASSGVDRPGYRALLAAVSARSVDVVVCWQTSRLWRRRTDRADAIGLLAGARVSVVTVRGPDLDLSTAYGRGMAGLLGEFDTMEAEVNGERVAAWHAQRAADGQPPAAGTRPFGYGRHRDGTAPLVWSVHPTEGPVVAEVFRRVLSGEAVVSLRDDLNRRGVTTSQGKPWSTTSLRRVLTSPTVAALRRRADGALIAGRWPALVDADLWHAVQGVLAARAGTQRRTSTRYLLSGGLAVCGRCGTRMTGHRKGDRRRYECRPPAERSAGCGLSVAADPLEDWVRSVVLAAIDHDALSRLRAERPTGTDRTTVDQLGQLERTLDGLADDLAAGRLSRRAYLAATVRLDDRADALRAALSADTAPRVLDGLDGTPDALAARWDAASVPWRAAFCAAVLEAVTIAPAEVRGGRFDPSRVGFTWRV